MFSACASSQVSSADSYEAVKEEWSGEKVDILSDMMSDSEESDHSIEKESVNRERNSVLDALSFSSDDLLGSSKAHDVKKSDAKRSLSVVGLVSCEAESGVKRRGKEKPRRTRSPMGSYIPPPGGHPLAQTYAASPGPAAYYPNFRAAKPGSPEVHLKFRHNLKEFGDAGPGPGAYMIQSYCCPQSYNECHFANRFTESDSVSPGPAHYNVAEYDKVGRFKPKAIILSRRKPKPPKHNAAPMVDLFGWTRFGKYNSPNAVLVSRPFVRSQIEPGPGAYDPNKCRDCGVGIILKGRRSGMFQRDFSIPGPDYMPPPTLGGPAWTLIGKQSYTIQSDSPGPIYQPTVEPRKPLSMTFLPFPVRGREEEPGPLHYVGVGDQHIKTKLSAPRALLVSRNLPDFGLWQRPGPNHYYPPSKIGFTSYNECSMKGFRRESISVQPGPADYNVPSKPPHCRNPPVAVFPHKHKEKPLKQRSPGFKYDPKTDRGTLRNVFLAPRWKTVQKASDDVPFYDLTGFTQRGKVNRLPVSFKSRQSPFVYQGVAATTSERSEGSCNLRRLKYEPQQEVPFLRRKKKPAAPSQRINACS